MLKARMTNMGRLSVVVRFRSLYEMKVKWSNLRAPASFVGFRRFPSDNVFYGRFRVGGRARSRHPDNCRRGWLESLPYI